MLDPASSLILAALRPSPTRLGSACPEIRESAPCLTPRHTESLVPNPESQRPSIHLEKTKIPGLFSQIISAPTPPFRIQPAIQKMVAEAPSIHIKDLTYNFPDGSEGLKDINVDLPPGSRTLLIGGMSPALRRANCDSRKKIGNTDKTNEK